MSKPLAAGVAAATSFMEDDFEVGLSEIMIKLYLPHWIGTEEYSEYADELCSWPVVIESCMHPWGCWITLDVSCEISFDSAYTKYERKIKKFLHRAAKNVQEIRDEIEAHEKEVKNQLEKYGTGLSLDRLEPRE